MLVSLTKGDRAVHHEIALFSPEDRVIEAFRAEGLALHVRKVRSEGPFAMLARAAGPSELAWLTGVIQRTRADVVHLHTFGAQVVGTRAAKATGRPIVRTEHSTRVFDDPSCWMFVRFVIGEAAISCSVSEDVRDVARKKAPSVAARMRVVPNGVPLEAFPVLPARPPAARARSPRAAVIARLEPRKGVDVALRALVHVPALALDVCGEGPDGHDLRALARTLGIAGRVRFLGHVSDVSRALADVDLVVSGARKEGLGLTLLEAMASGRLVVATPVGGVPEIVHDGATGLLSTGGGPEALSRAILRALSLPDEERTAIEDGARAMVEARFSVSAMRAAYAGIYRELVPAER